MLVKCFTTTVPGDKEVHEHIQRGFRVVVDERRGDGGVAEQEGDRVDQNRGGDQRRRGGV